MNPRRSAGRGNATKHENHDPRIERYLADLERAFVESGTDEPKEVLVSVRERIDTALDQDGTEVATILERLGPVERITIEASRTTESPSPRPHRNLHRVALAVSTVTLLAAGTELSPGPVVPVSSPGVRCREEPPAGPPTGTVPRGIGRLVDQEQARPGRAFPPPVVTALATGAAARARQRFRRRS